MSTEDIQFLQALHHGADLDAFFEIALQKEVQACGKDLGATGEELIQGLQNVQKQVDPVIARVSSLDFLKPTEQQLEDCKTKKLALETIRREMEKTLSDKSSELEKRSKRVQALRETLAALREYAATTPPTPEKERAIIKFGQQAVEKMGRK